MSLRLGISDSSVLFGFVVGFRGDFSVGTLLEGY